MKFLCGNCKAKYQIADEKVSGRTLRMKCRRCGHDILIDGHSMPASSPPAAASASTRRSTATAGTGMASVAPGPARGGSVSQPMPRPPGVGGPALPRPATTRSKPPSALGAEFRRHIAAPPEVPQRTAPYDLWHVAIKDVPVGPMTREELGRKIDSGAVNEESLCWREGMDDWRPLGELPELSQLLRRGRSEGSWSGRPPPRHRPPPHVPAPQGARPSQHPPEMEEPEEDYSEPTRIADLSIGMPTATAHAATGTQPKIAAPQPVATQSAAPVEAAVAPARAPKSNQGLWTGLAVGLLLGIVLIGGPALFRNTWGTPAPQPTQQAVVAPTPKAAEPSVPVQVEQPEEQEVKPEHTAPTKTTKPAAGTGKVKTTSGEGSKDDGKKLSAEEQRLLERMGVGGGDSVADIGRGRNNGEEQGGGGGGGPALTAGQLSKVVQDNKVQLQRCYESALRATGGGSKDPIKIVVSLTVGMSGSVKQVSTSGPGLGNIHECMKQSVKRWRFPASGGESPVEFPLVFQPGA